MATGKAPGRAAPKKTGQAVLVWGIVGAVLLGGCVIGQATNGDDAGTSVAPPTATERNDTVPILRQAFESQGICYGWRLQEGYGDDVVSVGSNLGDGVPVEGNPQCPRWVQVVGDVTYTSESSESDDYAYVTVEGSSDFKDLDLLLVKGGLADFDLTADAFVDDPGWAVTRAAVTLPLLVAERELASPEPVATAAPADPPAALADAGNDMWRDRWGWLLGAAGLLLLTVLMVTVGLVQRRRQRAAAAKVPAQRRKATTRTPERA
ncbi:hypothetical protein [Micromonospora sp. NPDC126480]|uniref:hypothetical protein n=1 Tax=Micromonospora sp. NPDC126480 TaxID=3155312 RepID=UPI0033168DDA